MNIFRFELKWTLKSVLNWSIVLAALLVAFFAGIFPLYQAAQSQLEGLLASFPPAFMKMFALNSKDLFSFSGFYNFGFMYLSLVGAILAAKLALTIVYREKRNQAEEFLLVKALGRGTIYVAKLAACLVDIVIVNVIYCLALTWTVRLHFPEEALDQRFIRAALSLFFTQLVFLAIGLLYGSLTRRIRSVSGAAAAIGMAAYVLAALANVLDHEVINKISPLQFFAPKTVYAHASYEPARVVLALTVTLVCLFISFFLFIRQERRFT